MRRIALPAIALAVALLAPSGAGAASATDPDLELEVTWAEDWTEAGGAYLPVQLVLVNKGKTRTVRIRAADESYSYAPGMAAAGARTSTSLFVMTLPPGETRVEIPVLQSDGSYMQVSFQVDGGWADRLNLPGSGHGNAQVRPLVVLDRADGSAAGDLARLVEDAGYENIITVARVPLESASRYWQSYLGVPGIVVLASQHVESLAKAERTAIARWVKLGGGTLWLHGEDPEGALETLGLFAGSVGPLGGDMLEIGCMTGTVILSPDVSACAKEWLSLIPEKEAPGATPASAGIRAPTPSPGESTVLKLMVPGFEEIARLSRASAVRSSLYNGAVRGASDWGYAHGVIGWEETTDEYTKKVSFELNMLLDGLHEIPRIGYCLISLLLAFLLGPLNLALLRSKRRLALFYVTAPLLALVGMVGLMGFTILDEGLHLKLNRAAVMVHDPVSGTGGVYIAQGTFGGLATSERPTFPVETAVIPFATSDDDKATRVNLVTDWTSAQRLATGWVSSRKHRGILTATPTRVRMGLTVEVGQDGNVYLENGLTSRARLVKARLPADGDQGLCLDVEAHEDCLGWKEASYYAVDVKPGQRVRMQKTMFSADEDVEVPLIDMSNVDWTIQAEMEGLPHVEDHAIDGEVFEESYHYVQIRHFENPDFDVVKPEEEGDGSAP
jgi:hypothetical protein